MSKRKSSTFSKLTHAWFAINTFKLDNVSAMNAALFHSCRVWAQNYITVVVAISSLTLSCKIMQGGLTTIIIVLVFSLETWRSLGGWFPGRQSQSEFQKDSLAFATLFNEIRSFDSGFCMPCQELGELQNWSENVTVKITPTAIYSCCRMVSGARHVGSARST